MNEYKIDRLDGFGRKSIHSIIKQQKCLLTCLLLLTIFMFVGCPVTEKEPIETPEEKESLMLSVQEKKDYEAAMTGNIHKCIKFIEGYSEGEMMDDVIGRFFELAKAGTYEDCEKFIELLPKDKRITEMKKILIQKKEEEDFDIIKSVLVKDEPEYLAECVKLCYSFLKNYPKSTHKVQVIDKFFEYVKIGPAAVGKLFIKMLPEDKRKEEILKLINTKTETEIYTKIQENTITVTDCAQYLIDYPEGKYRTEMADTLFKLAKANSIEGCEAFKKLLPDDKRIGEIQQLHTELEYKETLVIFDKFMLGKTLKWKLILKGGEFTINKGTYEILKPIIIAENAKLIIQPGTILKFAQNTEIICEGILNAEGLAEDKINFIALDENAWNNIVFLGKKSSESFLKHSIITGCQGISTKHESLSNYLTLKNEYLIGSGILCAFEASPMIESCEIRNNKMSESLSLLGGGICCWGSSSPTINNCKITENSSTFGGGIYIYEKSAPKLTDCIISSNNAVSFGGGVCITNADATFTKCTIKQNVCKSEEKLTGGGGVYCANSNPVFVESEISENSANSGAGLYLASKASPKFSGTKINGNKAVYRGGGILCTDGNKPLFEKCEIMKNSAINEKNVGGGIDCMDDKSNPKLDKDTENSTKDNTPRDVYLE
ncbi:MAG: right-handed parallel beta-helix repeat-containing protein [Planctomycetes bacterium]|nr:right-handed parallel beta-helix repeat-containing protein [Planctomycetota bacterium]